MFRLLLSKHYSYQLVRDISVIFSCHAFTNSRLHQSRQGRQHVDWWIHLGGIFTQSLSLCLLNELQNRCSLHTTKLIRLRHFAVFHPSIAQLIAWLQMTAVIHPAPDTTHNSRESAVYEDLVLLCWHPFCTDPLFLPSIFTQINLF